MKKYDNYEIIPANPDAHALDKSVWSKIKQFILVFCGVVAVFFVVALAGMIALTLGIVFLIFLLFKRFQLQRQTQSLFNRRFK